MDVSWITRARNYPGKKSGPGIRSGFAVISFHTIMALLFESGAAHSLCQHLPGSAPDYP